MIMPNNKKRHSTLMNRVVVTDVAGWGGGIVIGRITACELPACKMLLKICYRNIEIERMNTYIIFNQNSIINAMPHVLRASSAV
jgi:hypothetical protein